jgi:hypothetical protein
MLKTPIKAPDLPVKELKLPVKPLDRTVKILKPPVKELPRPDKLLFFSCNIDVLLGSPTTNLSKM